MSVVRSGLDNTQNANTTVWTQAQNQAVLIAGLTCACFSLLTTLITLRWFILMKRTFRHQLILLLICSDTFKAVWYFVFPIVVFSRGPVSSDSAFCQVSGFFLAFGIEASDCAILLIALHSILYIFKPSTRSSEGGGLYKWRKWIYPVWIAFPLIFASLAFVNDGDAYTTAGTYCYLPRRPYWYRLALSWIPRYLILSLIFYMYVAVYIYVTVKFHSFSHLDDSDENYSSNSQSHSHRSSSFADLEMDVAPDEVVPPKESEKKSLPSRPAWSRQGSYRSEAQARPSDPWDEVSFITAKPLRNSAPWQPGVQTSDFANIGENLTDSPELKSPAFKMDSFAGQSRKPSACPTTASSFTGDTLASPTTGEHHSKHAHHPSLKLPIHSRPKTNDPLKRTRAAIRKQLRYLFIYPAVYVLMWVFPFVAHCLLYDEYYVLHPIYWLTILQTSMLALQAAADCAVFSWREKPWRRIPADSRFSMTHIRNSVSFRKDSGKIRSNKSSVCVPPDEQPKSPDQTQMGVRSNNSSRNTSAHWWEAEGRKRKDSIWMGSDVGEIPAGALERRDTIGEPLTTIMSEDDREAAIETPVLQQQPQNGQDESSLDTLVGGGTENDRIERSKPNDNG